MLAFNKLPNQPEIENIVEENFTGSMTRTKAKNKIITKNIRFFSKTYVLTDRRFLVDTFFNLNL